MDLIRQKVIERFGITFYRINSKQVECNFNLKMTKKDLAKYVETSANK